LFLAGVFEEIEATGLEMAPDDIEASLMKLLKNGNHIPSSAAGVEVEPIDKRAVKVMAEVGIDMSVQDSKDINGLNNMEFDYVVTLGSNARGTCPFSPAKTKIIHKAIDDPPVLAARLSSKEEKMDLYRRVRDEIRTFVEGFLTRWMMSD